MVSVTPLSEIFIFDRAALRANRRRANVKFKDHAFLHEWANARLKERLDDVRREFDLGAHFGAPPFAHAKAKNIYHFDFLNADALADPELPPLADNSLDLITSSMALHTVNDLPGALIQMKRALKPDGLFLAAMAGGETLHELRYALNEAELSLKNGVSPRVFPFADKPQMGSLLQRAGFALPVVDSEIVTVTYENMFALLKDLRGMGQGNAITERSRAPAGRALFLKAAEIYQSKFADKDGRVRASFEIIFLAGWSPHASQQQPLRPGSAQLRLADALDTIEIKAGAKAAP